MTQACHLLSHPDGRLGVKGQAGYPGQNPLLLCRGCDPGHTSPEQQPALGHWAREPWCLDCPLYPRSPCALSSHRGSGEQGNSLGPLPQQIHSTTQELPTGALQGLTRVPSCRCSPRLAFLGSEAQGGRAGALRATPGVGVMLRVPSGRTQDPGCRSPPTHTGSPGGNRQVRDNLSTFLPEPWHQPPGQALLHGGGDSQRVPPATSCEVSTHACALKRGQDTQLGRSRSGARP